MAPQEVAPKWDDLFQIKGKVALVTGGSRGEPKMQRDDSVRGLPS